MSRGHMYVFFLFTAGQMLCFLLSGAQGAATALLNAAISKTATEIPVSSVTGFVSRDYILLENEIITYTSLGASAAACPQTSAPACFKGAARGQRDTEAAAHGANAVVYNSIAGDLDNVSQIQVGNSEGLLGQIQSIFFPFQWFFTTVYKIMTWNWPLLNDLSWSFYLKVPLWAMSFALGFSLWQILTSSGLFGIFRRG